MLEKLIAIRNDPYLIQQKREQVGMILKVTSANIKDNQINTLEVSDLHLLFNAYDQVFFHYWFRDHFAGLIKLSLSKRMTKSAGITICPKKIAEIAAKELTIEIRIGVDFFLKYDQAADPVNVCGLATNNSLQALQLVMEHEICHVIEFVLYHSSSCKKPRFKTMAANCFGHTSSLHQLPTIRQLASSRLGIKIGDRVAFVYEHRELKGIISNINKNATVMVPEKRGVFADKHGKRYTKYYVALNLLKKV